jgi:phage pi2 protein 07
MTDLKALAYELLHEAQQSFQAHGYLNPVAVVITASENLIFEIEYENEEEREEVYAEMMDVARDKNAVAIITVNDVYLDESGSPARLEGEGWGSLSESAHEAIMVTVSGGGFETWSVVSPYFSRGEHLVFQPARESPNPGGEIDLLGDWTGKTGAA